MGRLSFFGGNGVELLSPCHRPPIGLVALADSRCPAVPALTTNNKTKGSSVEGAGSAAEGFRVLVGFCVNQLYQRDLRPAFGPVAMQSLDRSRCLAAEATRLLLS